MKEYQFQDLLEAPLLNIEGLYRDLGKVLVVAPHPDDESLACGGLIALLQSQKQKVWVLFMTNGEASHSNSKSFPPRILGEIRKNEAINACKILGLPEDHIFFMDAGDGCLPEVVKKDKSISEKIKKLIDLKKPDSILTPWRRDHHSDHIATTQLVKIAATKKQILIVEYPVWLWKKGSAYDWPKNDEILPYRLSIDSVSAVKRKAIFKHQSQTSRLISDDPEGFTLTPELLEPFLGTYEYFFFPVLSKPSVDRVYFDNLYSIDVDPWNFESSDYEQEKYAKTIEVISDKKFNHVLELGCANGVFTAILAPYCHTLWAVDFNKTALESATKRCAKFPQCKFLKWDITKGMPDKNFDAIFLSEVGYYFNYNLLDKIFEDIFLALSPGGVFVMVHWTSYVRSYPLTGKQVHNFFRLNYSCSFELIKEIKGDLFELVVWEKLTK